MRIFKRRWVHDDDEALIAAFKSSGNPEIIGHLFEKYAHLVYGVSYRYLKDKDLCNDAVMNIFEKLFTDLKKYEISNFASWVHSTSRNYCFALLKKEQALPLDLQVMHVAEQEPDETDDFISKHIDSLQEALHAIKEEQKICIELFYLRNKSYEEITSVTGYSFKQVKSYIQNGKRNLKIYLTEKNKSN